MADDANTVSLDTIKQAAGVAYPSVTPADQPRTAPDEELPPGYVKNLDEPLDVGERKAPPPEEPYAGVDLDKAVKDAAAKAYPPSFIDWLTNVSGLGFEQQVAGTVVKRAAEDITGLAAAPAQAGAAIISGATQAPNLQGMPLNQVRTTQESMLTQRAELDKQIDDVMNHAQPGADDRLYILNQQANSLDARIKEADGILASGRPSTTPSPMTEPVGAALRAFGAGAQPAVRGVLDQVFPTNQDFERSLPGQIATGGADAAYLAAASVLGGPGTATAALSTMVGSQIYQDAKAHGAADEVAERASLFGSLTSAATAPIMGSITNGLAKSFAGMTAKEGIAALVQAGTHIIGAGGEMTAFGAQQNAIAQLAGYDPNRKLDEGFWQSFFTGVGWGVLSLPFSESPQKGRLAQPDVTVRNKPGSPPETGEVTGTAAPQPQVQAAVTSPEAQATAAVQANVGASAEQVIAQAGTPQEKLAQFTAQLEGQAQPAEPTQLTQAALTTPTAAPTAVVPTAEPEAQARPAVETTAAPEGEAAHPLLENNPQARASYERLQAQEPYDAYRYLHHLWSTSAGDPNRGSEPVWEPPVSEVQPKAWYEEPAASRTAELGAEPEETPVTREGVKREVNQAQEDMGLIDHLVYVPDVESLPDHVKAGLTDGERNSTAQIVTDGKLGNIYVIGDRFEGLQELRRAIIEETQPWIYRHAAC
jgi:hypothetical protein